MGKKILLADDSITIQKVIELTFSDEDFEVVTVGNGRLAIEKVQEVRPDVVLCDIIMPEKDGYEVCDFIKKHPTLSQVPVLLLTGAFEPFDQERAARVRADGSLAKPFEPETLIAKVKELLRKAGAAAPAAPGRPPEAVMTQAFSPPAPAAPPRPTPPYTSAAPSPPAAPAPPPVTTFEVSASAPASEPVLTPEPEVGFIPDEPFGVLDAESFGETAPPGPSRAREASAPTFDPDLYAPAAEAEGGPELVEVTPEETATLSEAPAAEDSAATVMFKSPWATSTAEGPAEEESRGAAPPRPDDQPFEEVLEEEPAGVPSTTLPRMAAAGPSPSAAAPPGSASAPLVPAPAAPSAARESAAAPKPPEPLPAAGPPPTPEAASFADVAAELGGSEEAAVPPPSVAAEVSVPVDMVEKIAQRVVAQISEKVVQQIAWEVIPELAEAMIKREIERLKAELQQL